MSIYQRIRIILLSLAEIALSVFIFFEPDIGISLFFLYISCIVLLYGIRQLVYFFAMGIHMVGGKVILYKGLIAFDMGLLLFSVNSVHPEYIMFYLLCGFALSGALSMLRAVELHRNRAKHWKYQFLSGLFSVIIAGFCIFQHGSVQVMVSIMAAGFVYTAVMRIVHALQRSGMIFIQ